MIMGAEVSVVMMLPIESTDMESYNHQSDQLELYVITSALNCCITKYKNNDTCQKCVT